ncbi:F-box/kelch-repeat protein At3g23880-like [Lotus japonicus]|uniref:F-box/kelch-repeat protein At3g23880-like n=1 Tax=Lotus japonicus TaxID=34305 RepID=UPI00258D5E39|nr:F-box/kelch-repeat protein At3g23880-like [Lotus japonicus]
MGDTVCSALMNTPLPPKLSQQHLPEALIAEVLSWLPVKDLTRFRCTCKGWNTLISDPTFIKLHLRRSATRNPHLLLDFTPLPVSRLLENSPTMLVYDRPRRLKSNGLKPYIVVGSCNGLICLHCLSYKSRKSWLCFWNPAPRLMCDKLGYFCTDSMNFKLTFGYHNSTDTFKVVLFDFKRAQVRVFTLGSNLWRDIQNLPQSTILHNTSRPNGVNLSGTLNWLALPHNCHASYEHNKDITVEQFMIISLDLGTETYTQILMPRGFDEVPFLEPNIGVLMDCLCFSHIWKRTHFVIWQMKEFGVEKSWTQLLKIKYQDLHMDPHTSAFENQYQLFPLCFYNGDTLVLASFAGDQAILYNRRDNTSETTRFTNIIGWLTWFRAMDYVESLVSPY